MKVSKTDFNFLAKLVKERSGICLAPEKTYLIESRLLPLLRKHNLPDFSSLVHILQSVPSKTLQEEVVEAMTTNETSFFRDIKPFNNLKDEVLPHVIQSSTSKILRIWSAACSSGQEPYSIAIKIHENLSMLDKRQIEIIATDLDTVMLNKARSGTYSQFDVQRGLPITTLLKYFSQEKECWTINQNIRSMVDFRRINLMDKDYSNAVTGKFDIIFCRNVLIYFDDRSKKGVLEKIAALMFPHSVLFLGSAENPNNYTDLFKQFKKLPGLYCLS